MQLEQLVDLNLIHIIASVYAARTTSEELWNDMQTTLQPRHVVPSTPHPLVQAVSQTCRQCLYGSVQCVL